MDLIIGKGQVGKSLYRVLKQHYSVGIRDEEPIDYDEEINYLHICFPYLEDFVEQVNEYKEEYEPEFTIIHSTVPVGTTRKCGENVVHSPVRGVHPKLDEGIETFVKYIGGKKSKKLGNYFEEIGIEVKCYNKPETTELLKILSTTYYAWNIVFCKEVKKICDKHDLDFEKVYTHANKTYNKGYKELGKEEVIRPILKPIEGKIGGHCIIPNAEMLNEEKISEIILELNEDYEK